MKAIQNWWVSQMIRSGSARVAMHIFALVTLHESASRAVAGILREFRH